ncbi:MAG: hypothetical protein L3J74_04425 [Bacteroidales bacterium]|nr:hypothetical protein [Bacteroidales bacterium]
MKGPSAGWRTQGHDHLGIKISERLNLSGCLASLSLRVHETIKNNFKK